MSIQDKAAELGLSANVLRPEKGDLFVLRFPLHLSSGQRDKVEATFSPMMAEFGCRLTVLDGGADLLLVKHAKPEGV